MSVPVFWSTAASAHWPFGSRVWRNTLARTPSARNSRPRMKTLSLKRSFGESGGLYQSVMMTPPNGSADASGMNETVSSVARQS